MKRNEQIWWFFIGLTLVAICIVALFDFGKEYQESKNLFINANSAVTSNLFTNQNFTSSRDDRQSPKNPQLPCSIQAASNPNIYTFFTLRQTVPIWEESLKISKPLIRLNYFMPLLFLCFVIFYRLARIILGDDYPL